MGKYRFLSFSWVIIMAVCLISAGTDDLQAGDKIPVTTDSEEARKEFLKGRDLFEKLRGQESLEHFRSATEKDPDFAMAYLFSSFSQPTATGFFEQLNKAVKLKEKVSDGERMWIEGVKAGSNGFPMKQREIYQKLVQVYPNDERAHNILGNNYFGTQEYQKAIEQYEKAIKINPDFSQPYNQLGYSYRFLKEYDQAKQTFKKYIELIPNDPNPYDSYAELLMKTGEFHESIEQYRKALEISPNFVASHIGIATNFNFLNQHEKARKQLDELFHMARNEGEKRAASFAKTVSYVDEGKMNQALKEAEWQFELGKKTADAANMTGDMILKGNILYEIGKYDEALKNYKRALKIMESSDLDDEVKANARRGFLFNSARVMMMQNHLDQAEKNAEKFYEEAKSVRNTFQIWLAHQLFGELAMKKKNYDKAITHFEKSNQQNPYNLYRLALAWKAKKNGEKAEKYCAAAANHNTLNNLQYAFCRKKAQKMMEAI